MPGGDIIKITKNSEKIFSELQDILKRMKLDRDAAEAAIMDAEIDLLCKRTTSLFQAWDMVTLLMRVHSPSSTEKDEAKQRIENAMRLHREFGLSITPKSRFLSKTLLRRIAKINIKLKTKQKIKNKQLRANRAAKIECSKPPSLSQGA